MYLFVLPLSFRWSALDVFLELITCGILFYLQFCWLGTVFGGMKVHVHDCLIYLVKQCNFLWPSYIAVYTLSPPLQCYRLTVEMDGTLSNLDGVLCVLIAVCFSSVWCPLIWCSESSVVAGRGKKKFLEIVAYCEIYNNFKYHLVWKVPEFPQHLNKSLFFGKFQTFRVWHIVCSKL